MWDRVDEQFDLDREGALEEEVLRLEAECRRQGIPIPAAESGIPSQLQHRRREMELAAQRDALRRALAQADGRLARDPYAGRPAASDTAALKREIKALERECAARGITPPAFKVDPRWYEHTERMACKRRRDALRALLAGEPPPPLFTRPRRAVPGSGSRYARAGEQALVCTWPSGRPPARPDPVHPERQIGAQLNSCRQEIVAPGPDDFLRRRRAP